jgi:hypothetical protein
MCAPSTPEEIKTSTHYKIHTTTNYLIPDGMLGGVRRCMNGKGTK